MGLSLDSLEVAGRHGRSPGTELGRRKRELVWEVRVNIHTDFVEELLLGVMESITEALRSHGRVRGGFKTVESSLRVLDGKTKTQLRETIKL